MANFRITIEALNEDLWGKRDDESGDKRGKVIEVECDGYTLMADKGNGHATTLIEMQSSADIAEIMCSSKAMRVSAALANMNMATKVLDDDIKEEK